MRNSALRNIPGLQHTTLKAVIIATAFSINMAYAATPGLPFTEDFSDTTLKYKPQTSAHWSIASQTVQLADRNAITSGLRANSVTGRDISGENLLSWDIKSADLNGDGYPDVIEAHRSNAIPGYLGVSVHMNNGPGGGFGAGIPLQKYTTSYNNIVVTDIDVGDVDKDGDMDIVLSLQAFPGSTFPEEQYGPNLLYLNDGTQTAFSGVNPLTIAPSSEPSTSIQLADLNCDGYLDVVVGNGQDTRDSTLYENRYFLNGGAGVLFSTQTTGTVISSDLDDTTSIGVADVNNDGYPDIVALNSSTSKFYLHSQNCNAPFDATTVGTAIGSSNTAGESLALGDLNNDGFIDAAYSRRNDTNLYVINNGSGFDPASAPQQIGADTEDSQRIRLADLDSDGDLDVLVANYGSRDVVYHNSGTNIPFDASTSAILLSNDTLNSTGIDVTDHNLDGNYDVVISTQGLNRIYINGTSGASYSDSNAVDVGQESSTTWSMDYADVDNDGDLDLWVGDASTGQVLLYLNNGGDDPFANYASSPAALTLNPAGNTIRSVVLEDINGDGWVDMLVGADSYPSSQITLFTNLGTAPYFSGTGTVVANAIVTAGRNDGYTQVYTDDFAIGDIDQDGDKDVVVGTFHQDFIMVNNGSPTPFSDATQIDLPAVDGTASVQLGI